MGNVFKQGFALIVGVGGKDDLPCTVNDANAIADILKHPQRCAYPVSQVRVLTEDNAKNNARRTSILDALDQLAQKTKSDSTVVIYFSGHGYKISSTFGDFYYLMPYGYDTSNLKDTAISGTEFIEKIKAIPAQKVLILLDCCHAGGFDNLKSPEIGGVFTNSPYPPETESLLQEGAGRVLIASSRENEKSLTGQPLSQFTFALLEALCGEGASNKDGFVRVADLAVYTGRVLPGRTSNRQNPVLNFQHADNFAVAYYAAGGVQSKGIPKEIGSNSFPEKYDDGVMRTSTVFNQLGQKVSQQINVNENKGTFVVTPNGIAPEEIPSFVDSIMNSTYRLIEKLPPSADKEKALFVIRKTQEFGELHQRLNEWKKIHDYLTKLITKLDKFISGIKAYTLLNDSNREWDLIIDLMSEYKKYYLNDIKIVDRYVELESGSEGGAWIAQVLKYYSYVVIELQKCDVYISDNSRVSIEKSADDLHYYMMAYLEQVDSHLLEVANKIQDISKQISNTRSV